MRRILSVALSAVMLLSCLLSTVLPAGAEETKAANYTASDLVDKSISEIVDIMGGEFDIASNLDITYITGSAYYHYGTIPIVFIYNNEVLPGMYFVILREDPYKGGSYNEDAFFSADMFGDNMKFKPEIEEDIRTNIRNYYFDSNIIVFGSGKVSDEFSADMTYSDIQKKLGYDFGCIRHSHSECSYQYLINDMVIEFYFQEIPGENYSEVFPDEMKAENPKLCYVSLYRWNVDTETDVTTDSEGNSDTNIVETSYTAADLVNMKCSEIIELMGGEFYVDTAYSIPSGGQIYFYNYEKMPGLRFHTGDYLGDYTLGEELEASQIKEIKNGFKNDEFSLSSIAVNDGAKLDDNISPGMTYNDITKYFGDISCSYPMEDHGIVTDKNGNQIVYFGFKHVEGMDTNDEGVYDADVMKKCNPEITWISVYPGYVSTTVSSDTDTDTANTPESDTDSSQTQDKNLPYKWYLKPAVEADVISVLYNSRPISTDSNGEWDLDTKDRINLGEYMPIKIDSEDAFGKWGLINYNGEIVLKPQFKSIQIGYDGVMVGCAFNNPNREPYYDYKVITEDNGTLTLKGYNMELGTNVDDYYVWMDSENTLYRTNQGSGRVAYDDRTMLIHLGEYHGTDIYSADNYCLISNGKRVNNEVYDNAGKFSDGIAAVEKNGKWGYIDSNGNTVIPFEYDTAWDSQYTTSQQNYTGGYRVYDATNGYVSLKKDGQNALYTSTGEKVIDFGTFDEILPVYDNGEKKLAWVKQGEKWGVIELDDEFTSVSSDTDTSAETSSDTATATDTDSDKNTSSNTSSNTNSKNNGTASSNTSSTSETSPKTGIVTNFVLIAMILAVSGGVVVLVVNKRKHN